MKIVMIGAGLAGLACATRLAQANHSVTIYDKGRVAGGRMVVRTAQTDRGPVCFDHGAQYFTARDPGFRSQVDKWASDGIVAPWQAAGDDAWIGMPGMNAPALALATGLEIHSSVQIKSLRHDQSGWQAVSADNANGPFEALVLALPAEQARSLVAPWDSAMEEAARVPSDPCWTVMAAFAARVPLVEDVTRHRGILDWAARNAAKPGRTGEESWVLHATPEWSRLHLDDPAGSIGPRLISALAESTATDLPDTFFLAAHRWRYARSGRLGRASLWNGTRKIGLCGDWLLGPRVECAWLSGVDLAAQICAGEAR